MSELRPYSGWRTLSISPRPPLDLRTNCPVEEEIYANLHYVSEVRDKGIVFLKSLGVKRPGRVYPLFQAFLRQSRTFFESSRPLHHRAKPLLQYYAFLNLAKAYIALRDPEAVSGFIQHGLRFKFQSRPLQQQVVVVPDKGVFPELYQSVVGRAIPAGTRLNIVTLLGYCSDVSYEYVRAGFGVCKITTGMSRLLVDMKRQLAWSSLALLEFDVLVGQFKKSLRDFHRCFEEIPPAADFARKVFGIGAEAHREYSYFQSRRPTQFSNPDKIPMSDIGAEAYSSVKDLFESSLYSDSNDFCLATPLRRNLQVPFRELLATYAIMYFLGSLVRYHPSYLESLLESKEGWIIERFARSAGVTLLRGFVNLILGRDFVFSSR